MKRFLPQLTYANVVSTLCLFLLLGGGAAFAATKLAKNSVGTKQIKNNAISTAKIKKGAVTGAKVNLSSLGTVPTATNATNAVNAAALGGQPGAAFQQRVRWALVAQDGTIEAQSGGISNMHDPGTCSPGCDFLDFGSSQAGKAIVLTSTFGANAGDSYRTGNCGGVVNKGSTNCSVGNDTNHILVRSFDLSDSNSDSSYWIAVIG
jgi:hypothetical protein